MEIIYIPSKELFFKLDKRLRSFNFTKDGFYKAYFKYYITKKKKKRNSVLWAVFVAFF